MLREFRFAARALRRWRVGAAAAVLTLAVAIGTAAALAAVLRAQFDGGAGIADADRVARIYAASQGLGVERGPVSFVEFQTMASRIAAFESVAAYASTRVTLDVTAPADTTAAFYVSPAFFPLMRARTIAGRLFAPADADAPVAIVSERIWRARLRGRALEDAALVVDGTRRRVVGVLPSSFSHAAIEIEAEVWLPLGRGVRDAPAVVSVIGRLHSSETWASAAAQLEALSSRAAASQWGLRAIPIREDLRIAARRRMAFTIVPALLVLLIGAINAGAMLMARGVHRHEELSLRRALGATRARIARDLFLEHAILGAVAALGGIALAFAIVRIVSAALGPIRPEMAERITAGPALLALAAAAAAAACALSALVPAIALSKRSVAHWLRGLPPRGAPRGAYGARDLVVFIELACATVLVILAAMWLHLFAELQRVRLAFPAAQIVGVRVPDVAADAVSLRLAGVPGVVAVTRASAPFGGRGFASSARAAAGGPQVRAAIVPVGDRFVETLGLPILRGRSFERRELDAHARAAVLSESAARALFGRADPIGAAVTLARHRGIDRVTVIGICGDAVDYGALMTAGLARPDVYVPYEPVTVEAFLLVRTAGDGRAMLRPIADAARIETLTRQPQPIVLADDTHFVPAESLVMARVFGAFAAIALLLAGSGIFGAIAHSVALRTREFGVRLALGAAPARVLRLVLSREAPLLASAVAIGMLFTISIVRVMFPDLLAVTARSATTWLLIVGTCGGAATVACALASRRVLRMDAARLLRR